MSDVGQINQALQRLFHEEGQRIVFWNDPDQEFAAALPQVMVDGVTVLRLDAVGALSAKIRLERDEPTAKFLLYAPSEEPDYENDWLLDIRLYSRSFRADRASILLQELGLLQQSLRSHLALRRKFFDSKERLQKLKILVVSTDAELDLDRKMIAVIAKAEQAEPFNLVRTIFDAWCEAAAETAEPDLDVVPAVWERIEKFELDVPFWQLVKTNFGYQAAMPTLKNLLLQLMLTDFAQQLDGDVPQSLRALVLPRACWENVVVCLAEWRDSSSKGRSYDLLSAAAADELKIAEVAKTFDLEALVRVKTFLQVERQIASGLNERVRATAATINAADIRTIAAQRQAGHWATLAVPPTSYVPRQALHAVYTALVAAADFFALRNVHAAGFSFSDASSMYQAYAAELFRFDYLYRHFCEAADDAERTSLHVLKSLRREIESCYTHWYLKELALTWGRFMEPPGTLLRDWKIDDVPNQYEFYDRNVAKFVNDGESKCVYVIISDAFRYEAAHELAAELNGKDRFKAELTSQLGVLPSYTALGMASLLPHKTLAYKAGTSDVLVNGQSCVASERDGILRERGGMACKFDDVMAMKRDDVREFMRDKKVVYIYHDKVDAIGDDRKTEAGTFGAVRAAINELTNMVVYLVNNLNVTQIVVTADHGFLFAESAPTENEKSKLDDKPPGTVLEKKRFLLGRGLGNDAAAWHGTTEASAEAEGGMEFWIPKGVNRFHFVGGARFVHGGAMPQEIVVPVLTVKNVRGKAAQTTRVKSVTIQVLGNSHRITMTRHRFELLQMDEVSDRVKPITLKVAIYDGDAVVSNVESVRFEFTSPRLDERKVPVNLVLMDRVYNKKQPYRLVLTNAETDAEEQSIDVIIDKAFSDDF